MKKLFVITFCLMLAFGGINAAAAEQTANPTTAAVLVDGRPVAFQAYNIGGYNYFRLRDLAYVLNGSPAQFNVTWSEVTSTVIMLQGYAYEVVGGEMENIGAGARTAVPSASRIMFAPNPYANGYFYLDGERISVHDPRVTVTPVAREVNVRGYLIGGSNFFRLRDIGELIGFDVDWDAAAGAILIRTALSPGLPPPTPEPEPDFERQVFELTNQMRVQYDVPPLIWHDELAAAARAHSVDMSTNNFMSHSGSDGSDVSQRLARVGIRNWSMWAENVASGQRTPEAVVESWMNSPGHRANILNPNLTHLGVGFDNFRWTQKFI